MHEACSTISGALDSSELSVITETLELKTEENILYMNVTNREYYVSVKIDIDENESFHATVNAGLFLKLISQITIITQQIRKPQKRKMRSRFPTARKKPL